MKIEYVAYVHTTNHKVFKPAISVERGKIADFSIYVGPAMSSREATYEVACKALIQATTGNLSHIGNWQQY